jgi:hypothetical protein
MIRHIGVQLPTDPKLGARIERAVQAWPAKADLAHSLFARSTPQISHFLQQTKQDHSLDERSAKAAQPAVE